MSFRFHMLSVLLFENLDLQIPELTGDAAELMPWETSNFGQDLWYILQKGFTKVLPMISSSLVICLSLIGIAILLALLSNCQKQASHAVQLTGIITIASLMLNSAHSLIILASETVARLSEYGKLLLPVLTASLAAAGGSTSSASLYTATAVFDALICATISHILVPLIYIFLTLCVVNSALEDALLQKLRDLSKWVITWSMKLILTVFTSYISISGIITGTADQAAVKATKMTISSAIPVVGGMLSDASETVLIGASVVKNTAGVYGILALVSLLLIPLLQIAIQYGLLRITAALSSLFAQKNISNLIDDFAAAMGFLLGMTGTVCLILLISIVCFLKGMG